ncbi:MAG TPA: type II toxin-antitoxin system VapC family toxin [Stellaceae bacterium]|nr:type II toxin-antitoxin system VapC family toxin [Stellaceae bacterium]
MRVTFDTNVLVRLALADDLEQTQRATTLLQEAEFIAIPLPVLCEFVWVTTRVYRRSRAEVGGSIRRLLGGGNVHVDRPAVEAGLAMLDAGGDFADGIIAFAGRRMGGAIFASFDRQAVALVEAAGGQTRLLAG